MTNLELLPRKEFVITLTDGTRHEGKFGTWALAHFGEKRKMSLSQISATISMDGQLIDLLDYVVCAVVYKERMKGEKPSFNAIVLSQFLDDYNYDHQKPGLVELLTHSFTTEDEKKSEETETPLSNGENSNA